MGYTGARVAQAIGTGLHGFGGHLQRVAQEDRERQAAEQAAARDAQRFETTRLDNFMGDMYADAGPDTMIVPETEYSPVKGFGDAIRRVAPDGSAYMVAYRAEKPERPEPSASDWQIVEGADGFARVNRLTGETVPVSGVQPRPATPPQSVTSPNWQTLTPPGGGTVLQVNPQTGESRPVVSPDGSPLVRDTPMPPSAREAIMRNRQQLAAIDRALAAIDSNPDAVGGWRNILLPEAATQRLDPEGITARAEISDIGSLVILDRSGAAVQAAEFERIRPFIPSANDSPEAVRQKLERFRQVAQDEARLYEESFGRGGGSYTATHPENPY